jgi:hypothetical protein
VQNTTTDATSLPPPYFSLEEMEETIWCSHCTWYSRINGGVVHGRGVEFWGVNANGGVVHGLGFESLSF